MDVKLPKLGEGAEGGSVVNLLVNEGEAIAKGQTLLELENEKAVAPIPSPVAGTVGKIRVKVGDRVSVGQVLLTLSEGGTAAPTATAAAKPVKAAAKPAPVEVEDEPEEEIEASDDSDDSDDSAESDESEAGPAPAAAPSIRRMARDLGIDLRKVRGSERGGRIVLDDVRSYIQRLQRLAAQPRGAGATAKSAPPAESIDFSKWGEISKKPLTPLRKVIARRMVENWNTIPHVTQFDEVDITALNELRKKFAPIYEQKGARLTLTSFVLKAVAATLKKHPIFNSSLDEVAEEIVLKEYFHLGLAVDTDQGLIVPVIRDVDKKSLFQLSKDIAEVADKARERKLTTEELKGGTFTISNQGGIGGAHFTPIINKPEVAILGLGRGALKPAVCEGKIEPRLLMPIGLSYDHRVIDGGTAARFTLDLIAAFGAFGENEMKLG